MKTVIRELRSDVSGASAAEYALLIALIGGVIILGVSTLAPSINQVFNSMGSQVATANSHVQ